MSSKINDFYLIPAPFVSVNKTANFAGDGQIVSHQIRIDLEGTMLPNMGSPMSTGFWTLNTSPPAESFQTDSAKFNSLLAKQELMREAFSQSGFKYTYSATGVQPVEFYPILESISFEPGPWVNTSKYRISMRTHQMNKVGSSSTEDILLAHATGLNLTQVNDVWSIRPRPEDDTILEISRSVDATANLAMYTGGILGVEPWRNAKTWVLHRLANYGLASGLSYFNVPTDTGVIYNLVEEEDINKFAGSYGLRQRYIYHRNNYIEKRSISTSQENNRVVDEGPAWIETITVNGSIEGLDANNNPANKLANAVSYWETLRPVLGTSVGALGSGTNFSLTKDVDNGTLTYSIQFVNSSGATYRHTYDVSYELQNSSFPTVTINGQINGVTPDDFPGNNNNKYVRALSGWIALEPTLKNLAFAYTTNGQLFGYSGVSGTFADTAISKRVSSNTANGTIQYTYIFGYLDGGSSSNNYLDQYNIDLNTSNALDARSAGLIVSANINGTIIGLSSGESPSDRLDKAISGWQTVQHQLYTRVSNEMVRIGSGSLPTSPIVKSKTVGINRIAGQITYNLTFDNTRAPYASGVAVQEVRIDDTHPNDVVAVQIIPGRLSGPIIQNISTRNEKRRTINTVLTMTHKGPNQYWEFLDKPIPANVASGHLASGVSDLGARGTDWFIQSDSDNWDWKNGLYSRNTVIIY